MSRSRICCLLLALITLLLYLPVRHHEFINYDDRAYVTENPIVQSGLTWPGVKWAFTTWHDCNWHPLTWLSHMLDCQWFGLDAGNHHLVNVLFHSLNAALLFLLLRRLTGALWPCAFVAAVFAWHPLRVESVAWVAERKDVLCAFFGLLSLLAYARYAQGSARCQVSGVRCFGSRDYWLVVLFFALGLMAKPMLVTLPLVMLLLDYWPLQRGSRGEQSSLRSDPPGGRGSSWRWLLLEKAPFFLLAAASCVVTFIAQQRGESVEPLGRYPVDLRMENAVLAYAGYLFKCVWPVNLAVIYPLPEQFLWEQATGATLMLALISWWIWRARRRAPYLLTGWLWFLVMLLPVIGLIQVGRQAMADRYTYLPLIGVGIAVAFGAGDLAARLRLKPALLMTVAALVLGGLVATTAHQLRFWRDSETLFAHALAVTRANAVAHNNLGITLLQKGRAGEAVRCFQQFLGIQPENVEVLNNLAWVLATCPQASVRDGATAVRLAEQADLLSGGNNPETTSTLAAAYAEAGRFPEALAAAQRALQLNSSENNAARIASLKARIECYQAGSPFRDAGLTNGLARAQRPR